MQIKNKNNFFDFFHLWVVKRKYFKKMSEKILFTTEMLGLIALEVSKKNTDPLEFSQAISLIKVERK